MATLHISELERILEGLKLETPIPRFDTAEVLLKPLDLCRSYLAEIFSSLVNSEPLTAYNSIQLSNDPLHGDFTVVLPKLCPGTKAKEAETVADNLIKKVSSSHYFLMLPYAYSPKVSRKPLLRPSLVRRHISTNMHCTGGASANSCSVHHR